MERPAGSTPCFCGDVMTPDLKQKLKEAILPLAHGSYSGACDEVDIGVLAWNRCVEETAKNIDKLLEGAKAVKGWVSNGEWFENPEILPEDPSHHALLLMIEEIPKDQGVTKEEVIEALKNGNDFYQTEVADRIQKFGVRE